MLKTSWSSLSLRTSFAVNILLAVLPLALSAFGGFFLLKRTVIADFHDVASRQVDELQPLQRLQVAILRSDVPLEEYLITRDPEKLEAFHALRRSVDADFSRLAKALEGQTEPARLTARARDDWESLDAVSNDVLSVDGVGDPAAMQQALNRFDVLQHAATDKLGALYDLIEDDVNGDFTDARLGYARAQWMAGTAALISLFLTGLGVFLLGRIIINSVDRLVDGAERFARGERQHLIDVQVPPELHRVAEEFNVMIRKIHESERELEEMARRDRLSGLLNRRSYDEMMDEIFARFRRLDERVALIMVDIDHFKQVNDRHGHAAGDEVIRAVSSTMMAGVRAIDRVFRVGGEEFAILLPAADAVAASATAERIRAKVEALDIVMDGRHLNVTISAGIATTGSPPLETPAQFQQRADEALYRAKREGRNRVIAAD